MLIGILKRVASLTDLEKCLITVAKAFGHNAFVFTATNVNFENQTIQGKTLIKDKIVKQIFPFPDVVQNRLTMAIEDKDTYLKLAEQIPFTTHRIGSKVAVSEKLEKIECIQQNLIEVISVQHPNQILEYLQKHHKIILKPSASFQAKGIYTLFLDEHTVQVQHQKENQFIALDQLHTFYQKNIYGKSYLMSPYIVGLTQQGQTTVWRIHLVRGENAEWQLIKYFPYVNLDASHTVTNGMQGALITTREALFLEQQFPALKDIIHKEVLRLAREFPSRFQTFYPYYLDALGLDVAITEQGKVYIYEVNAGAGIGFMNFPVAMVQVRYMEYLIKHARPPFAYNFLPPVL